MKNNENLFVVVQWPEVQSLMEHTDFYKNAVLINDSSELCNEFGSSSYLVRVDWLNSKINKQ